MRHALPRLWLAASLAVALAAGCEHTERIGSHPDRFTTITRTRHDLPGGQVPPTCAVRLAEDGSAEPGPIPPAAPIRRTRYLARRRAGGKSLITAVEWTEAPAELAPTVCLDRPVPPSERAVVEEAPVPVLREPPPIEVPQQPAPPAAPPDEEHHQAGGAHAADYRWLVGSLQRDAEGGTWSILYGDAGSRDLYGGRLQLIIGVPLTECRAGRRVRVEGKLVDPLPQ